MDSCGKVMAGDMRHSLTLFFFAEGSWIVQQKYVKKEGGNCGSFYINRHH